MEIVASSPSPDPSTTAPAAPEPTPAPVAEPAAPRSTSEIVSQVVADAEGQASERTEVPATEVKPVTEAELSEAARFIMAQGHKWGKRPDGKTDLAFLPATTVAGMLDRYVEQHRRTWDGERTTLENQYKSVQADLTEFISAIKGDPKAFLETVSQYDQRYKSFLTPQEKREIAADADDPEPQPDVDLGNGRMTYSLEGLRKLRAWDKRQYERVVDQRLQPLAEREKAEKERAMTEQAQEQVRARAKSQMDEAQTWPLFGPLAADGSLSPFQQEVLDVLKADPKISLHSAYMKVAGPRFAEDDAARRARYAKEQNSAPKSTSMARIGAEAISTPNAKRTTQDIVRETISRLEA